MSLYKMSQKRISIEKVHTFLFIFEIDEHIFYHDTEELIQHVEQLVCMRWANLGHSRR